MQYILSICVYIYIYIQKYIDNYAPTDQKKLCFASRHPGKGGASKGFREAAAAAAALAANDELLQWMVAKSSS